ncbi:TetR/AcrR family transcriptional regulator [Sphaerisporangium album]|uniref:TetR/AcrR family transcriptional regulator n=1 Tax=Sphaerisporangium album TaxID=509200 RepID=A0A367FR94_9ACTN|nr:TetR/AcrR family transcriptional regulator [Sphaerisporangium album]RCG32946.1 TetR/AcrR family transcriptional regulator [Sphaerisporangium album]
MNPVTTKPAARRGHLLPSGEPRPRYDLDRLLAVAVSVFTERGYDGTSIEHLAKASGLSKSSIYHHIESKEQLLRIALGRALDPLLATTREDGALTGRAVDRLRYLIRRDVQVLADRLPYVTLLLRVHGNTETERWAMEQRRGFDKVVAGLVQKAIDEGDIRPDVDAATTARLMFGLINSLIEWYRPSRDLTADVLSDRITAMIFDGIGTGAGRG